MNLTKIEWCDYTWNPVTGCLHGCEYCYARGIARRFGGRLVKEPYCHWLSMKGAEQGKCRELLFMGDSTYPYGFDPTFHRYRLDEPQKLKNPSNIFVCSMADLFGDWVPDDWIQKVLETCEAAPQHRYLFLTKNPARLIGSPFDVWDSWRKHKNWWFGATITNKKTAISSSQIGIGFHSRFLSLEPLQEDINQDLDLAFIDWVIIGAETGNRKGKVIPKRKWIQNIVKQCHAANIPVFMKNSLTGIWDEPLMQEFPWEA